MTNFFHQLRLLLWKNFIIKKRSLVSILFIFEEQMCLMVDNFFKKNNINNFESPLIHGNERYVAIRYVPNVESRI